MSVFQGPAEHRIFQLHVESARWANSTDREGPLQPATTTTLAVRSLPSFRGAK